MNIHIFQEIWTAKHFGRFRPELGMMDNNVPFKVSKKCEHQSPVISTIDCWFNEFVEGDDVEPYLDEIEATNNHC